MSKVLFLSNLRGKLLNAGFALLALAMPMAAAEVVIVTNFTGGNYVNGIPIGNGANDAASRDYVAFGATIGDTPLQFVSLETIFDNNAFLFSRDVTGGIYSDNAGNPGSELVAFNAVTLPAQSENVTITSVASFLLLPQTTYWFVLTGPVGFGLIPNWQSDIDNTAPVGLGLATAGGFRFSGDNQVTWVNSTVNHQLQINADDGTFSEEFPIDQVPEPSTFVLAGSAILLAARFARRR